MATGSPFTVASNRPAPYWQQIPSPYVSVVSKVYAPSAVYAVLDTAPPSILKLPVDWTAIKVAALSQREDLCYGRAYACQLDLSCETWHVAPVSRTWLKSCVSTTRHLVWLVGFRLSRTLLHRAFRKTLAAGNSTHHNDLLLDSHSMDATLLTPTVPLL
jgi:hypothetical protein